MPFRVAAISSKTIRLLSSLSARSFENAPIVFQDPAIDRIALKIEAQGLFNRFKTERTPRYSRLRGNRASGCVPGIPGCASFLLF